MGCTAAGWSRLLKRLSESADIAITVLTIAGIALHLLLRYATAALEQLTLCKTMILDKTGTLTYGRPS
jgi:cation transport ATPase